MLIGCGSDILAHLNSHPDEPLAGTEADRPLVAVRVRASVGRPAGRLSSGAVAAAAGG